MDQLGDLAKHLRAISFVMAVVSATAFFAVDITVHDRFESASLDLARIIALSDALPDTNGRDAISNWLTERVKGDAELRQLLSQTHEESVSDIHLLDTAYGQGQHDTIAVLSPRFSGLIASTLGQLLPPRYDEQAGAPNENLGSFMRFWNLWEREVTFEFPGAPMPAVLVFEVSQSDTLSELPAFTVGLPSNRQNRDATPRIGVEREFILNGPNGSSHWRYRDEIAWGSLDWVGTAEISNINSVQQMNSMNIDELSVLSDYYENRIQENASIITYLFSESTSFLGQSIDVLPAGGQRWETVYLSAYRAEPVPFNVSELVFSYFINHADYVRDSNVVSYDSFEVVFEDLVSLISEIEKSELYVSDQDIYEQDFEDLQFMLNHASNNPHEYLVVREDIEILGLKLDASEIQEYGTLIVALLQLYFIVHLRELNFRVRNLTTPNEGLNTPWMGLYGGLGSKLATFFLAVALPFVSHYSLVSVRGEEVHTVAWMATISGVVFGFLTFVYLLSVWINVDALLGRHGLLLYGWRWFWGVGPQRAKAADWSHGRRSLDRSVWHWIWRPQAS